jgi:hypothetical protein
MARVRKCKVLRVAYRDEQIAIRIGSAVIAFAAQRHPDFWDDKGNNRVAVTDRDVFAGEVCRMLNAEYEDGSTMVSRLLDQAILNAIEDGAEGVRLDGEE